MFTFFLWVKIGQKNFFIYFTYAMVIEKKTSFSKINEYNNIIEFKKSTYFYG